MALLTAKGADDASCCALPCPNSTASSPIDPCGVFTQWMPRPVGCRRSGALSRAGSTGVGQSMKFLWVLLRGSRSGWQPVQAGDVVEEAQQQEHRHNRPQPDRKPQVADEVERAAAEEALCADIQRVRLQSLRKRVRLKAPCGNWSLGFWALLGPSISNGHANMPYRKGQNQRDTTESPRGRCHAVT